MPRKPDSQPVFVLFTPRTGSHLLAELMNSVPSISIQQEPLHRLSLQRGHWGWITRLSPHATVLFWRRAAYRRYMEFRLGSPKPICGGTLGEQQLRETGIDIADLVRWFDGARFLVLYRRSLAEQYTSWRVALRTRQWHWMKGGEPHPPFELRLRFERRAVLNRFELVRQFYSDLLEHPELRRRARLLSYEELRDDPQRAFDEVLFPWLGLPHTTVRNERLRKQGTRPMRDVIENYAELEDVLTGPIAEQRYSLPPPEAGAAWAE